MTTNHTHICLSCEMIENDRSGSAQVLLGHACRCSCGAMTRQARDELWAALLAERAERAT